MKNNLTKLLFIILTVIVISCNGGGSSGSNTTPSVATVTMNSNNGGINDGESNVSLTPSIVLSFSSPMKESTITPDTVKLKPESGDAVLLNSLIA